MARKGYIPVQVTVSIPRAGEFKVAIPIFEDRYNGVAPSVNELIDDIRDEVVARLRVKLEKGERKRYLKAMTK